MFYRSILCIADTRGGGSPAPPALASPHRMSQPADAELLPGGVSQRTEPPPLPRGRGGQAFTILEICLAVLIAVLLATVAVPSINGLVNEQKRMRSFNAFDELVRQAQKRSVLERRPYLLVWEKEAIVLRPAPPAADPAEDVPTLELGRDDSYDLLLPATLVKEPPREWVFWPTGTCEPAVITFRGEGGGWSARYDALTGISQFVNP